MTDLWHRAMARAFKMDRQEADVFAFILACLAALAMALWLMGVST